MYVLEYKIIIHTCFYGIEAQKYRYEINDGPKHHYLQSSIYTYI